MNHKLITLENLKKFKNKTIDLINSKIVNPDWNATSGPAQILHKPAITTYTAGQGIKIENGVVFCDFIKLNYLSGLTILERLADKISVYHSGNDPEDGYTYDSSKLRSVSSFMYMGDYGNATINFNFDADAEVNNYFYAGGIVFDDFTIANNTGKELTFGIIDITSSTIPNIPSINEFSGSNPYFSNSSEITLSNGSIQYVNGTSFNKYLVVAYLRRYDFEFIRP